MNAVIRVDSSERIGSGHLMRCLTLAERMRRDGMSVHFICRDLVGNLAHLVTAQGFALHLLPAHEHDATLTGYAAWLTVSQEVDTQETVEILRKLQPIARLVVDHYALAADWERRMRPLVQEIFVIDDLANRAHDCDTLLDQNFYRDMERRYDGLVPARCKLLLGPKYALLRREFYEAREKMPPRTGAIRRILIFYGGSDPTGETEKAIRALLMLRRTDIDADVIVGGSNVRREEIARLCAAYDVLHYHCQVDNMAEFMACADLCLGAGGTTTWERCFLGLPAIVTAVAENQIRLCEDAAAVGYIRYLGQEKFVTESEIFKELKNALTNGIVLKSPFEDVEGGYEKSGRSIFAEGDTSGCGTLAPVEK